MRPLTLDEYQTRYRHLRMERRDGVLQVQLHSNGASLRWGLESKSECADALADIASDPENRVVILSGTGDAFITPGFPPAGSVPVTTVTPERWTAKNAPDGRRLLQNHLDVPVPMIAAVNGPATLHAEMALLCDIVLAADHAVFQDSSHFLRGVVPGDGAHIVWPALLGINRARYFLLTGEVIGASEALRLGIVNEVLPPDRLLPRAWELAARIASQPSSTSRLFRDVLLQPYRQAMAEHLGFGLALEGLGAAAYWPFGPAVMAEPERVLHASPEESR